MLYVSYGRASHTRQGTNLDLKSVHPVFDILTCLLSGSHVLIW